MYLIEYADVATVASTAMPTWLSTYLVTKWLRTWRINYKPTVLPVVSFRKVRILFIQETELELRITNGVV